MEITCYFTKLVAPRPTFPADMTPEEAVTMKEHAVYWRKWMEEGKVIAYGPVMDPKGVFGMGVVNIADEEGLKAMLAGDPVTTSGLGRWEYHPMRAVIPDRAG
jgi:uncharacterized protein